MFAYVALAVAFSSPAISRTTTTTPSIAARPALVSRLPAPQLNANEVRAHDARFLFIRSPLSCTLLSQSQEHHLPKTVITTAAAAGAAALLVPGAAHAASLALPALADNSFVQASSLIFVSEIGDKTFFIAALLAARASRLLTFAGCAGALAFMTLVSVVIGQVFHAVPTSLTRGLPIDDYVAIISFLYFGVKSLIDASAVEEDGAGIAEEREDAEETLAGIDVKGGWPLVVEACTLTVAAEIGDRSQLATIALSAAANPVGVFFGGTAGHCLATGMAVLGGSFISKYLSERVIGIIGGVLFLGFALTTAVGLF